MRAVLFDVGGPLDTEVTGERMIDEAIIAGLRDAGFAVTPAQYAAANALAVRTFAPNAYTAIIFELCDRDPEVTRRIRANLETRVSGRRPFELRDGIAGVLAWLFGRGLKLGLAANQPASAIARLDEAGIGGYFHHREVTGVHGFHKPDVRVFLRACEGLGVAPDACIMVGDRIDNDIAPARMLGMRTVLFRTGRHIEQQPRTPDEMPDAEVRDAVELRAALERLL
ncbi:MAG TPA: HAD family hydrolase [Dehalococcoidia bacterium]|nr:HAD family hydrolase [Dehalococcoidia bacterium]